MWTHFYDMSSGGGHKEPQNHIYIEAPEAEAEIIFQNRLGHNPHRVTCTCCGADYSVSESPTLAEATRYQRENYRYVGGQRVEQPEQSLAAYRKEPDVLIIRKADIKPEERQGELRASGYVWVD